MPPTKLVVRSFDGHDHILLRIRGALQLSNFAWKKRGGLEILHASALPRTKCGQSARNVRRGKSGRREESPISLSHPGSDLVRRGVGQI